MSAHDSRPLFDASSPQLERVANEVLQDHIRTAISARAAFVAAAERRTPASAQAQQAFRAYAQAQDALLTVITDLQALGTVVFHATPITVIPIQ
jgi:hypothetical protein